MVFAMITQHLVHAVQRRELPLPRVFVPRALLAAGSSPWAKAAVINVSTLEAEGSAGMPEDAETLEAEGSAGTPEGASRGREGTYKMPEGLPEGLPFGPEGATDVPEGPVLHDAEALEADAAADTPEGSTDPGEIGASALRSSIHGGG